LKKVTEADPGLLHFTETLLAGAIGAASARVMVGTVVKGEVASIDEVMEILDETSQVIEYSHRLEVKSRELEIASAELQAANERLKEVDRLKDDFLSTVSHELRTPLTSIRSFSEILFDQRDLDPSERKEFLGIIIKESERLTRLINQLLDLAKLEAGRGEWQISDIDPKEVIEEAVAATSSLFQESQMKLDVTVPDRTRRVRVDRDRFIQVIVNLLSNAVKFCNRPDPNVRIAVSETNDGLLVSIEDNGPGIPRGDERRIFEKFEQADATATSKPVSTGLGLPICLQIIEYFGGRIWVEKGRAVGAKFLFTVPFSKSSVAAPGE
jgi:signal transduction histidine kinase